MPSTGTKPAVFPSASMGHGLSAYRSGCRCARCAAAWSEHCAAEDAAETAVGPDDPPKWLTSAHADCYDIEHTSVHTRHAREYGLETEIHWPCSLRIIVTGGTVTTDAFERWHDAALTSADARRAKAAVDPVALEAAEERMVVRMAEHLDEWSIL